MENGKLKMVVKPYSFNKSLFEAYDDVFKGVNDSDWVCLMDGDACFLEMGNFGHVLQHYIDRYPNVGLFTCLATKCSYGFQRPEEISLEDWNVQHWAFVAREYFEKYHGSDSETSTFERRFAGHLVMMKKSVWTMVRPKLANRIRRKNKKILGFDTQLSHTMTDYGLEKRLIKSIVVAHNFRPINGKNDKII